MSLDLFGLSGFGSIGAALDHVFPGKAEFDLDGPAGGADSCASFFVHMR